MTNRVGTRLLAVSLSFAVGACGTLGPSTVSRDHANYGNAIGDSLKQQTLLNIVRLRYSDYPTFMEVSQVIAGYELQASAGSTLNIQNAISAADKFDPPFISYTGAVGGGYSERPTVIYAPLTGQEFMKKLMLPLPPAAVLSLLQAGYPATMILPLAVDSIGGIANGSRRLVRSRPADPQFQRVAELLLELQESNALMVRVERRKDGTEAALISFREAPVNTVTVSAVKQLLRLSGPGPYVFGYGAAGSNEVALATRSMLEILTEVGTFADVPQDDVTDGRANPVSSEAVGAQQLPLLQIHSGPAPANAHVVVQYKGRRFWIADNDRHSKSILSSLMLLSANSDPGVRPGVAPVVATVHAN